MLRENELTTLKSQKEKPLYDEKEQIILESSELDGSKQIGNDSLEENEFPSTNNDLNNNAKYFILHERICKYDTINYMLNRDFTKSNTEVKSEYNTKDNIDFPEMKPNPDFSSIESEVKLKLKDKAIAENIINFYAKLRKETDTSEGNILKISRSILLLLFNEANLVDAMVRLIFIIFYRKLETLLIQIFLLLIVM